MKKKPDSRVLRGAIRRSIWRALATTIEHDLENASGYLEEAIELNKGSDWDMVCSVAKKILAQLRRQARMR